MINEFHILIIGSGSVGKRHAKNLKELGCKISCMDPRADRCEDLKNEVPLVSWYTDLNDIPEEVNFNGVIIASPTAFHKEHTLWGIKSKIPVLLEKPAAMTAEEAYQIREAASEHIVPIVLGYSWRWWPPLQEVRKLIASNTIGSLRHVQFHMSAHLADWHPWEPYQSFFMSKKALGGGALLDESHWIDLMIWFLGNPDKITGHVSKISDLEIETDDNVDIICSYKDVNVTIHLDLYGRPHEKFIRFVGENGTLLWSANPNRISICKDADQHWETHDFNNERNDMFIGVAKEFMSVLNGGSPQTCTFDDGVKVMELIEAVRSSSNTGKTILTNNNFA